MPQSYSFTVIERNDGSVIYNFLTSNEVGYTVLINTAQTTGIGNCFESPNVCENGYIIAFMRVGKKFEDKLVLQTIDSIIDDFIEKFSTNEAAFFYTCDNSDGKHLARHKMFENYICNLNSQKYKGESILFEDKVDNTIHCIGCFFRKDSRVGELILIEFEGFAESLMLKS